MFYQILLGVVVVIAVVIITIQYRAKSKKKDQTADPVVASLASLNQRLDTISGETNRALRETIGLVSEQLKESRESTRQASENVHKQVESFTAGLTSLRENISQVQQKVSSVASFQEIFKAPKLRGRWGETSLDASLSQYFPKERYTLQHYFKSGEAVDAVLRLPNNFLLPIDSKFPLENFERLMGEQDEIKRDAYRKAFATDVKREIDDIASKYILPAEGTVSLALMFIPAEAIYYEIISTAKDYKDLDLASYARGKKVFIVSPNTLFLTLSAIMHWFKDMEVSQRTQEILKKLERVSIDGQKLGEGFARLGKHLSDAKGSFDDSEKRLDLMLDRVDKVIHLPAAERPSAEVEPRVESTPADVERPSAWYFSFGWNPFLLGLVPACQRQVQLRHWGGLSTKKYLRVRLSVKISYWFN